MYSIKLSLSENQNYRMHLTCVIVAVAAISGCQGGHEAPSRSSTSRGSTKAQQQWSTVDLVKMQQKINDSLADLRSEDLSPYWGGMRDELFMKANRELESISVLLAKKNVADYKQISSLAKEADEISLAVARLRAIEPFKPDANTMYITSSGNGIRVFMVEADDLDAPVMLQEGNELNMPFTISSEISQINDLNIRVHASRGRVFKDHFGDTALELWDERNQRIGVLYHTSRKTVLDAPYKTMIDGIAR